MLASPRRVLFLAYMFPPLGGSGVQRTLKFIKYLPAAGWEPLVVTVKPVSYYIYDPSLLAELPPTTRIDRTESLDPLRLSSILLGDSRHATNGRGVVKHPIYSLRSPITNAYRRIRAYAMFPDAQLGWFPFAVARGLKIIEQLRPSVIYSPVAPYTSTLVAAALSRLAGLPYVIDFRDPWTDDMEPVREGELPRSTLTQSAPTRLHLWAHRRLERRVVSKASGIVVYGDDLATRLSARYPGTEGRIATIENGFDPADMNHVIEPPRPTGEKHRIVYTGSLFPYHTQNLQTLFAAIDRLPLDLRGRIEVLFVGQAFDGAREMIKSAGLDDIVKLVGYVSHSESLGYLRSAAATLVLVRAGDRISVTGKVYELLMAGKPILAIIDPDGACADVLRRAKSDQWISVPSDVDTLTRNIETLASQSFERPRPRDIDQFSRVRQTERLGAVLDRAVRFPVDGTGISPVHS